MAKYEDEQNIREIESRIDIVELISETVTLSRKGNNYWGLCPFHQEKTPSFSVNRDKQMYYCFGCHAGGNVFSYLMKKDGLEFREALEILAVKAGVDIIRLQDKKTIDKRKAMVAVNNAAAHYYQDALAGEHGQDARDYLTQRGINSETITSFKLGYALDEWNQVENYLLKKGFAVETIKACGLIKRSENQNRFYDQFRQRIIFPIFQYNQDVVGFGGRSLGEALPKYLNTAETELFSKRKNLYGLAQARESIREKNSAFLVEGYMDCIKLQQVGIKNVVASLGTALTEEQARLLRRYTEKVVVLYDGDDAGQRETLRAITVLRGADLKVEIVSLPPGKDPDEYIDYYGKEGFWNYVQNNACSDIEFKLNRYMDTTPVLDLAAKIRIIDLIKQDIGALTSALEKDFYIKMLARRIRVEENIVRQEFRTILGNQSRRPLRIKVESSRNDNKAVNFGIQERILAAMLRNTAVLDQIKQRIGINFFANPEYRALIATYDRLPGDQSHKIREMGFVAAAEGFESAWARIAMLLDEVNPEEARDVEEFIMRVAQKKTEARWEKAFERIRQLSDNGNFDSVLSFILKLDRLTNATREGVI
ncbi:MAG: DNA primase [Firmicutes bacterium]|nr:DNA primase [Bacillota bacterium]